MALTEKDVNDFHKSGFPKKVIRHKYDLVVNERLQKARKRTGLSARATVEELAKRNVHIGLSTLQGYEANEKTLNHRYPSLPVLIDLAKYYECSVDYLLGLSDKFKRQDENKRVETDLVDLLESRTPITYNGNKLNKKQREVILNEINALLG